jgi:cob(I)alamin adenosyltransferase
MAHFYTGTGDSGTTGYLGPGRISKASLRIEAVGSVDEASAALGLAKAFSESKKTREIITHIQKQLYFFMTELSAGKDEAERFSKISEDDINWLEGQITGLEKEVPIPRDFILSGDTVASGALALARTIVRRAERRAIALFEVDEISKVLLLSYLNRLSSLLFVLEIFEADLSGNPPRLLKEE